MINFRKKVAIATASVFLLGSLMLSGCGSKPAAPQSGSSAAPQSGSSAAPAKGSADNFPSRPITIMIPHKAGSSTDIMARALQPYFQKALGEKAAVVIENNGDGGGNAAHLKTYKADPDGYTIEISAFPSMPLGEIVKDAKYKTLDFTYLHTITGADYNGIIVKYDSPYKDLKSLIEAAKTQKVTMSGSGIGTNGHMALMLLQKAAGAKFEYISYDGGTEAAVAVAGGHAMSGVGNVVSLKQMVDEKKIRILAVIGDQRHKSFPDVPTAVEAGYKGAVMDVCVGAFAPPNLPAEVKAKLETALNKAVNDPEFKKQAEKLGSNVVPLGSKEFSELAKKIYDQATQVKDDLKAVMK